MSDYSVGTDAAEIGEVPGPRNSERSPRRGMCAAVLCLEAITVGLTIPVMISLGYASVATSLAIGLGIATACLLLAGMLRSETAYLVGWLLQIATIAVGFLVPMMFVLGGIFAALWAGAYLLGRQIEQDRAAAYAAYDAASTDDPEVDPDRP